MKFIKQFNTTESSLNYGGKANHLIELYNNNFQVPFGGVIISNAYECFLNLNKNLKLIINEFKINPDLEKVELIEKEMNKAIFPEELEIELQIFFQLLKNQKYNSVAVRSSGNLEDGILSSFAGQFESFLNIKTIPALKKAVIDCWTSMYGKKVVSYCINNKIKISDFNLNVIIQGQINSEASGVVFTANPLTGDDKLMVIEAVSGLGEALVQGSVIPDMYHFNWYEETVSVERSGEQEKALILAPKENGLIWNERTDKQQVLNQNQIKELGNICLQIQQFYGEPLDIEWAFAENNFYILQARSLTSIHFKVDYNWTTADLKDGGISSSIATPMMFSLYEYIFEHTMPAYFKSIKIFPKRKFNKWFNWWFGYSYWNMLAAKEGVKQIPGFNERNFDQSLGIDPDYEGNGFVTKFTPVSIVKGLSILSATNKSIAKREADCTETIKYIQQFYDLFEKTNFNEMNLKEIMIFAKTMIYEKYLKIEGNYFYTIYDNSNAATFCQEAIDKVNKKTAEKINYLNLVCGLTNLSHVRPIYELWNLSRSVRKNEKALNFFRTTSKEKFVEIYFKNETFPFYNELTSYIKKFKFHSQRELDLTVPNWDEEPSEIFDILLSFINKDDLNSPLIANQKQGDNYNNELKKIKNSVLLKKIETHRNLLWWREEMRDNSTKMYYYLRKIMLEIGNKLVVEKMIDNQNDVFFLTISEIFEYQNISQSSIFKKRIEKNKIFYKSFRNFNKPNEIWENKDSIQQPKINDGKTNLLRGISGASGYVKGRAVVINTIYEANKIQEKDILVTKFTDPAWTSYFSKISGLVTETGGMLSHGAVVSREFGIPAVLGVKNATIIIKSGDIIEIDGSNGIVKIVI